MEGAPMDRSELADRLRNHVAKQDAKPAMEILETFLATEFGDAESFDEVRTGLEQLAQVSLQSHRRVLRALDVVISDPPMDGTLAHLVGWEGNWVLDDPSDAGALRFLREVADMLREIIATAER
jgi:hypothetical protein